jgi:hypothetical protein
MKQIKHLVLSLSAVVVAGSLLASCAKRNDTTVTDTTHVQDSTNHTAASQPQNVTIQPAEAGPDYKNAKLTIVSPREGQVIAKPQDSVMVVMQVSGMELAKPTEGDSTKGIAFSKQGQHVHVIVDDKPYMADYVNGQPFNVGVLAPGKHTLRAFPSRSWHESVKTAGAFATRTFYVGEGPAKGAKDTTGPNLKAALLTYSRPKGTYSKKDAEKLLLDFFVSNAKLGENDYKVKVAVDGKEVSTITDWKPYYLSGLSSGDHTVTLQLIDPKGNPVPGAFNNPTGKITVQQ